MKRSILILTMVLYWTILTGQLAISPGSTSTFKSLYLISDTLLEQNNYQQYVGFYEEALRKQNIGIVLASLGGISLISVVVIMGLNLNKWEDSGYEDSGDGTGFILFAAGAVMFPIGLTKSLRWSSRKRSYKKLCTNSANPITYRLLFHPMVWD